MNTIQYKRSEVLTSAPEETIIFGTRGSRDVLDVQYEHPRSRDSGASHRAGGWHRAVGHMRLASRSTLGFRTVPVRVHRGLRTSRAELLYLVDSNTKRRQLTMREIGKAYAR